MDLENCTVSVGLKIDNVKVGAPSFRAGKVDATVDL